MLSPQPGSSCVAWIKTDSWGSSECSVHRSVHTRLACRTVDRVPVSAQRYSADGWLALYAQTDPVACRAWISLRLIPSQSQHGAVRVHLKSARRLSDVDQFPHKADPVLCFNILKLDVDHPHSRRIVTCHCSDVGRNLQLVRFTNGFLVIFVLIGSLYELHFITVSATGQ